MDRPEAPIKTLKIPEKKIEGGKWGWIGHILPIYGIRAEQVIGVDFDEDSRRYIVRYRDEAP